MRYVECGRDADEMQTQMQMQRQAKRQAQRQLQTQPARQQTEMKTQMQTQMQTQHTQHTRRQLHTRPQSPLVLAAATPLGTIASALLFGGGPSGDSFWRAQLAAVLPTRNQSDMLVAFYLEHLNLAFGVLHAPSFRRQYEAFWQRARAGADIDLPWLALLLAILAVAALYAPVGLAGAAGLVDDAAVRGLARVWHGASRTAMVCGGEADARPRLEYIAVFVTMQLYWHGCGEGEVRSASLGQAVHHAQALCLDRDEGGGGRTGTSLLDAEMRRRLWWELWVADADRSLNSGRAPLIQTRADRVPLPANYTDEDLDEGECDGDGGSGRGPPVPRPRHEFTTASLNTERARVFRVFHRLYADNRVAHSTAGWDAVWALDREVAALQAGLPAFFQTATWAGTVVAVHPDTMWQYYALHSTIHLQRLRMLRPFLTQAHEHQRTAALAASLPLAQAALDSYKVVRRQAGRRHDPKFGILTFQAYSSAVQVAAFLLVEWRQAPAALRADVALVIDDMTASALTLPILQPACRTLRKMLQIYDCFQGVRGAGVRAVAADTPLDAAGLAHTNVDTPESMAPVIGPVFGGEMSARNYLRRCGIEFLLNRGGGDTSTAETSPIVADVVDAAADDAGWADLDTELLQLDPGSLLLESDEWNAILQSMDLGLM